MASSLFRCGESLRSPVVAVTLCVIQVIAASRNSTRKKEPSRKRNPILVYAGGLALGCLHVLSELRPLHRQRECQPWGGGQVRVSPDQAVLVIPQDDGTVTAHRIVADERRRDLPTAGLDPEREVRCRAKISSHADAADARATILVRNLVESGELQRLERLVDRLPALQEIECSAPQQQPGSWRVGKPKFWFQAGVASNSVDRRCPEQCRS